MKNEPSGTPGTLKDDKTRITAHDSPAQHLLAKVDRRDKLVRLAEVFILLILAGFNVFSALRLQTVIDQNQKAAVARSAQAERDRREQKDYIKCVVLLRYDVPPENLTTRKGTEKALDTCAKKSSAHEVR